MSIPGAFPLFRRRMASASSSLESTGVLSSVSCPKSTGISDKTEPSEFTWGHFFHHSKAHTWFHIIYDDTDWNTMKYYNLIISWTTYVVQLISTTSVLSRLGSFTIFSLLNDISHGFHFSTRQNMKPQDCFEKKSNFNLYGFSRYLTPNMALQKIILTFLFLFFVFFLLPDRRLCVLPAITSRRYWAIETKFHRHAQGWI